MAELRVSGLEDVLFLKSRGPQTVRTTYKQKLVGATSFTVRDLTGETVVLILRPVGGTSDDDITWTADGTRGTTPDSTGVVDWIYQSDDTLDGKYNVAAKVTDSSTSPDTVISFGSAVFEFIDDVNG